MGGAWRDGPPWAKRDLGARRARSATVVLESKRWRRPESAMTAAHSPDRADWADQYSNIGSLLTTIEPWVMISAVGRMSTSASTSLSRSW